MIVVISFSDTELALCVSSHQVDSAVDKRLKEMEALGKVMENALKTSDWMAISNGAFHYRY